MTTQDADLPLAAAEPAVAAPTLRERVSALEERTRPRPKSLLDQLKDWGGLASLIIALAYSFPLGLWDRFVGAERKRVAEEVTQLRGVIDQTTVIMADGGRALAGISDPFLYDTVSRAINTRLYVLMAKNKGSFEKHKDAFTAPEALVIGYSFLSTNQSDAALQFFEHAKATAGADVVTEVEAMRMQAKALFMPGAQQDRAQGRAAFKQALTKLEQQRSYMAISSYMTLTAEWGMFELFDGDWACGQQQIGVARQMYQTYAPSMNDQGNFARLIEQKTQQLSRRPGQPAQGC